MSGFARELAAKKRPLPRPLRLDPAAIAEEDGDSSSSASSVSSVGTIVPSGDAATNAATIPTVPWYDFFAQELFLEDGPCIYHVYITPPQDLNKDPLFVCHHGAGSGGLSWALFAREIRKRLPRAGVLAIEARDHGSTVPAAADGNVDFSLVGLSADFVSMVRLTQAKLTWPHLPDMVFVGHSLGGAVMTDVAEKGTFGSKLVGFAVIDVVEGSAMDAIKSMQTYLDGRPSIFPSVRAAVDWHVRSRTLRYADSAEISVPTLLCMLENGSCTWRTELRNTQKYWEGWFTNMSQKFLAGKAAKLLLLAGTDRLDKPLMIGQMQGKFQMHVFPEAGHFVQEDLPEKTADSLVDFYKRNDRSALILPPKVSDLIAQGKKV